MTDQVPVDTDAAITGTSTRNILSVTGIMRAAGIVMVSFVLTGVLGIVRQAAIGAQFGAGGALDAFFAANRVSETLFTLVSGGALGSAFIPVFSRYLSRDDTAGAWRVASAVVSLVFVAGTILALGAAIFADPIASHLLLPGADPAQQALTAGLMRVMLATVVIFGVSGLGMAILNAHQRFLAAALAPGMYNVGLLIGALVFVPLTRSYYGGVFGLAFGALLGAALHLVIQLPSLLRLGGSFQPSLDLTTPGVREVLVLMGPRVLGLGVVQINFWVNAALTSGMREGSLTALTLAFSLLFTVLGVLGQSVGTAVFPTLAALNAQGATDDFRRILAGAMRGVLFMALPATVGLIVLSSPIVAVIYGHGKWTANDTTATAWALSFYAVGLAGFALQEVLARAFYALRDTWTPVVIGVVGVILNIVLSLLLIRVIGGVQPTFGAIHVFSVAISSGSLWTIPVGQGAFGGLALANALATILESAALWLLMRRRLGNLMDRQVLSLAARSAVSAIGMGVVVFGLARALDSLPPLFILAIGALAGAAIYELLAILLRVEEARSVPRTILRRVRR